MTAPAFLLRAPRPEDVAAYCGFLTDPEVHVWLEDRCQRPLSLAEIQAFVLGPAWCRWAIECDGAFVGLTGLEDYDPARGTARFFIVIGDRKLWGRGLGEAVIGRVLDHGFQGLGLRKILSDFMAPNQGSRLIHERAGFQVEGVARQDSWRQGQWVDRVYVAIFKDEFDARAGGERS
jgi:RimJ/RimL family protein N-acetyltransferase